MEPAYYVALSVVVAIAVIVLVVRQRGARQRTEVELGVFGAKAKLKSSVAAEIEGVKAGRDVKVTAGEGDPARMRDVEAGRDVIRDTTGRDPKA
jgi:hypothetical protein